MAKRGARMSEEPRETPQEDCSFMLSEETEMSISDDPTPPAKKIRTNTSQQPRDTTSRDSSLLPPKETEFLPFGVSISPKKKSQNIMRQEPRETTQDSSLLPSTETEVRSVGVSISLEKKSRKIMRQEPRETTQDSPLLPSKETEVRPCGVSMSPAKKTQKIMSQQPRKNNRGSSLLRSKENGFILFGVSMVPGKKSQTIMRQEPLKMSLSSASPMSTDEDLTKTANFLEKEEEKRYGVSTELTLSITDPWIIKKELNKSDIRGPLFLSNAVVESHILNALPEDDQKTKLGQGNGMTVTVYDNDTHTTHEMLLVRSGTNQAHYCLKNSWTTDFVKRRGLKIGDEIGLCWARLHSQLHFRVLSSAIADEKQPLLK